MAQAVTPNGRTIETWFLMQGQYGIMLSTFVRVSIISASVIAESGLRWFCVPGLDTLRNGVRL